MKAVRLLVLPLALALLVATGCEPSGPKTIKITGTVSLDGTAVAEGDILFRDAEGDAGSCAGKIVDGSYTVDSTLGSKKVEIRAMRETGQMDTSNPGEEVPMLEMYIPAKFNTETTLTADVSEGGETTVNFEMKSGE